MPTDTNINNLIINKLTKEKYSEAKNAGNIVDTELYLTTGEEEVVAAKPNIVSTYMYANKWDENIYEWDSIYPYSDYDITVEVDGDKCTTEQFEAWGEAKIVGSTLANNLKALGKIPSIDIPIIITWWTSAIERDTTALQVLYNNIKLLEESINDISEDPEFIVETITTSQSWLM